MRAYPFGVVFYNDLHKAETWAVEHSRLTHQAPMALAACAAMAVGTALSLRHSDPLYVAAKMIDVAKKYDTSSDQSTADCLAKAGEYAAQAQAIIKKNKCKNAYDALLHWQEFKDHHIEVFYEFLGWNAKEAIAAGLYLFLLSPNDPNVAICLGVHTPGDSDSIATIAGALVGGRCGFASLNVKNVQEIENKNTLHSFVDRLENITSSRAKPNSTDAPVLVSSSVPVTPLSSLPINSFFYKIGQHPIIAAIGLAALIAFVYKGYNMKGRKGTIS